MNGIKHRDREQSERDGDAEDDSLPTAKHDAAFTIELETCRLRETQHNIQILNRRAAGALAQIVEHRDQPRLLRLFIGEDIEGQAIAAREDFHIKRCGEATLTSGRSG